MLQRAMLPVLLKLLHLPTVLEAVPHALTRLLEGSRAMQQAANDSDAVSSLTTLLQHEQTCLNRPRFKVLHRHEPFSQGLLPMTRQSTSTALKCMSARKEQCCWYL